MGKINIEDQIHLEYGNNLREYWFLQSKEFQIKCHITAEEKGQSGYATFILWLFAYMLFTYYDYIIETYEGDDC